MCNKAILFSLHIRVTQTGVAVENIPENRFGDNIKKQSGRWSLFCIRDVCICVTHVLLRPRRICRLDPESQNN